MDVIERLTKQGKDLGYEGEILQTFVKEQQIELRDERKAMREAEREKREAENAKREDEEKFEHEKRESEAKIERERLEAEAKIEHEKLELKREIEKEAREAETAKREDEELFKREELEIMERIEREKHDIERERIEASEKQREADERQREANERQHKEEHEAEERQRKEEREAAERHDQLLCDMEKAKLALEQDKINSQQFQQQRDYEFKCQFQDRQHGVKLERLEAQKALTQPRETIKAKAPKIPAFNEGKDKMDSYLLRFERYATAQKWEPDTWATVRYYKVRHLTFMH